MSTTCTRPDTANMEDATATRTRVRHVAMYLSIGIAALYGMIASHVVTVVAGPAEQVARGQLGFALPAAAAYLLGAGLLWRFDRRLLWIAGAVLQVLVIGMYFMVAPQRDPAFEIWGITIRVFQVGLLAALTYLSSHPERGGERREQWRPVEPANGGQTMGVDLDTGEITDYSPTSQYSRKLRASTLRTACHRSRTPC